MVKKVLLTTVILLLMTHHAAAQSSDVWLYNSPVTGNVKERSTVNHQYNVTCFHNPAGQPTFILYHDNYCKIFTASIITPPFGILRGFSVEDMRLDGTTCWVCGSTWRQSDTPTYFPDGTYYYPHIEENGFVAKFDMDDVIDGMASWKYKVFSDFKKLTRIACHGNGATAIGIDTSDTTKIIEFIELSDGSYKQRVSKSSFHEEYFMDIVNANGKVAVLSRFNYPPHFMYYRSYFGMRYGTPASFAQTSTSFYRYDTYDIYGYEANFPGLTPIVLSATHKNHGVTLSYVGQYDSKKGRLFFIHIPSPGATNLTINWMKGNGNYKKVVEADFNYPLTFNTFMTVIMEDSIGRSELRFPQVFNTNTYTERYFSTDTYRLLSIMQYQSNSGDIDVMAAGYRPYDSKLVRVGEYLVNSSLYSPNCISRYSRSEATYQVTTNASTVYYPMETEGETPITFNTISYQTSDYSHTIICNDGSATNTDGENGYIK